MPSGTAAARPRKRRVASLEVRDEREQTRTRFADARACDGSTHRLLLSSTSSATGKTCEDILQPGFSESRISRVPRSRTAWAHAELECECDTTRGVSKERQLEGDESRDWAEWIEGWTDGFSALLGRIVLAKPLLNGESTTTIPPSQTLPFSVILRSMLAVSLPLCPLTSPSSAHPFLHYSSLSSVFMRSPPSLSHIFSTYTPLRYRHFCFFTTSLHGHFPTTKYTCSACVDNCRSGGRPSQTTPTRAWNPAQVEVPVPLGLERLDRAQGAATRDLPVRQRAITASYCGIANGVASAVIRTAPLPTPSPASFLTHTAAANARPPPYGLKFLSVPSSRHYSTTVPPPHHKLMWPYVLCEPRLRPCTPSPQPSPLALTSAVEAEVSGAECGGLGEPSG
uniref:Uncharacterized protein n=1 Tax=Mycena chlorophos TaxID=658473 RepID=A0ABQ0KU23_MYCCL|nr:predicted protein [Mycena chlorophos]